MPTTCGLWNLSCTCGENFKVGRFTSWREGPIDPEVAMIAQAAIEGTTHLLMERGEKYHYGDLDAAANTFRKKRECSCAIDRMLHPEIRRAFEIRFRDLCIQAIESQLQADPKVAVTLNIAFGCSGYMMGEQTALFHVIEELYALDIPLNLNISLIDSEYKSTLDKIQKIAKGILFNKTTPVTEAVEEFQWDMEGIIPKDVVLNTYIFSDFHHYDSFCQQRPEFNHHVLAGIDIGGKEAQDLFLKVRETTGQEESAMILLNVEPAGDRVLPLLVYDDDIEELALVPEKQYRHQDEEEEVNLEFFSR